MRLSWSTALIVPVLFHGTLVLSQDQSAATTTYVDQGAAPTSDSVTEYTPEPTYDPATETAPQPTPEATPSPAPSPATGGGSDYNTIPHEPEGCNDFRIFNARGSDEPYPGRSGGMLGRICELFQSQGESCDYEDVIYPANISYSGLYCASANIGATAGQAQISEYIEYCPDSKVVLLGYSQGADVVGDILGGGGGEVFDCEQPYSPPLSRNSTPGSSIVAVVTMGDPRFTKNQPYNIGRGSTFNGNSARQGQQLANLNKYKDIIAMWCNHGDPVCAVGSDPVNITAHWSYYDQYTDVASQWIVATALGHTDKQIDLDGDGKPESVNLTGAQPSKNNTGTSRSGGGDKDAGSSLHGNPGLVVGVSGLVVLFTAGIIAMS